MGKLIFDMGQIYRLPANSLVYLQQETEHFHRILLYLISVISHEVVKSHIFHMYRLLKMRLESEPWDDGAWALGSHGEQGFWR